ncbi:unnamed protein product [Ectocarpus fasciculatus]
MNIPNIPLPRGMNYRKYVRHGRRLYNLIKGMFN